jgi:hypothetical protein
MSSSQKPGKGVDGVEPRTRRPHPVCRRAGHRDGFGHSRR